MLDDRGETRAVAFVAPQVLPANVAALVDDERSRDSRGGLHQVVDIVGARRQSTGPIGSGTGCPARTRSDVGLRRGRCFCDQLGAQLVQILLMISQLDQLNAAVDSSERP